MYHISKFVISLALVALTAVFSSYLTYLGVDTFYTTLNLPPLNPPNAVFRIVWPTLYALMIISFYIILNKPDNKKSITLFIGQLVLHILWCYLFFASKLFGFAFVDIILLILTVFSMINAFKKIDKAAAYIQYPYLLWLLFAAYLNAGIWYLN